MNTREPQLCPAEQVPTELTGQIEYSSSLTATIIPSLANEKKRGLVDGRITKHNELGALVNTYSTTKSAPLAKGKTLRLMPQLPDGEEDTGKWQWNTGETTREITVNTDWSYVYRVTYTNSRGVESRLAFFISTTDKGEPVGIKECLAPSTSTNRVTKEGTAYDLQGRVVRRFRANNTYIVNGKKIMM